MARPIVTTDAPGCRDTVDEGVNGFKVPIRDAAALAEAMARFVDDPALIASMGAQSRRLAEERFDVRKINAVILATMGLRSPPRPGGDKDARPELSGPRDTLCTSRRTRGTPSSMRSCGAKPRSRWIALMSAKVSGTSPGCIGSSSMLGLAPAGRLDQADHPHQLLGAVIADIVEPVRGAAAAGLGARHRPAADCRGRR